MGVIFHKVSEEMEHAATSQNQLVTGAPFINKKHLKNVGPIRYCEPSYSPGVATAATVARRLRIDVHDDDDDNDNA